MNEIRHNHASNPDDDIRFDRLVDGELPPDEYRALVASLDDEPGGWRRCAMAFLESQALAGELVSTRRSLDLSDDSGNAPGIELGSGDTSRPPLRLGPFEAKTLLAMAASFLVAFGLGVALPRVWPLMQPDATVIAGLPAGPSDPGVADGNSPTPSGAGANPRHDAFKPVANVRLVVDGPGGDSTSVGEVPMYELPGSVEQWLVNQRPALSREVLQTLKDRGHQVERNLEYVPVQLEDGRQGIVPVEGYQIGPRPVY
jgi:hypothetical protein